MHANCSTRSLAWMFAFAVSSFSVGCVSAGHSGGSGGTGSGGSNGTGGAASGVGGAHATGGSTGAGGTTSGSGGATTGAGGTVSGTGGAAAGGCPANAIFCSGFEDAALPANATYLSSNDNNDPTKGLVFDKTTFHTGLQSLKFLPLTAYAQREVSVPAAPTFWFRAYLRTDVDIGGPAGSMHNVFFEAMYSSGQQDKGVEIVEEDCELGANINDSRYGSNGTTNQPGCPTAAPLGTTLPANMWHCIEGFFDGTQGNFQLFANGTMVINQSGIAGAKQTFSALRFGYREYHAHDRTVWYDDVVVAPTRVGCL
jgi:hypothetical protein